MSAHGFGNLQPITCLRRGIKPFVKQVLELMCEAGELAHFNESKQRYYLVSLALPASIPNKVWLLNPFDNLVIQRKKLKTWFDFDYQIKVYVPEAQRKYGYYSLIILWRDPSIGRVDVKADRKNKCLLLQQLNVKDDAFESKSNELNDRNAFFSEFMQALIAYMKFNNCEN